MDIPAQPTGAVTLDYALPPEDLRPYLSVFYEFRADVPFFEDTEQAALAQFRFMLAGSDAEYQFADGHRQRASQIQIVGPTTGPTTMRVRGPVHGVGVGLMASGWGALLDFEASLLVNRAIDATELFPDELRGATEAILACPTLDDKVRIGSALAHRLIGRGRSAAFDFIRIVDDWLAATLSPEVDELVRATGLSRRQVERRCNAYYGAPPKMLARKYRALKASIALAKGDAMADDLLAQGFYDQSHFIREIKAFTGMTPSQLREDAPTIASLTLKRTALIAM